MFGPIARRRFLMWTGSDMAAAVLAACGGSKSFHR